MAQVLAELPAIGKTQRNTQQNFMFRGHDDVLNALNPLLAKADIFPTPEVLERVYAQRSTKQGGVMHEVNLLVRYTFWTSDGSYVQASAWGEGTDSGDKATNKAMTMAFKNVLMQVFAINTEDGQRYDTDRDQPEPTVVQPQEPLESRRAPTDEEVWAFNSIVLNLIEDGHITEQAVKSAAGHDVPLNELAGQLESADLIALTERLQKYQENLVKA
jgi:hypothetical protein